MTKYNRLSFLFAKNAAGTSQPVSALSTGLQNLTSRHGNFRASVFLMGESYITSDAMTHQLGHHFGLSDAITVTCIPASLMDPTHSCSGGGTDSADTMGSSSGYQHFSSAAKFLGFWLDPGQVQNVTASGEYTIDQIELPSAGAKALRIPVGKDASGNDTDYWVEYRMPGTFDTEQGVQVRYQTPSYFSGSYTTAVNTMRFTGPAQIAGGGGSISGKVVRESDGTSVTNVNIQLYDSKNAYTKYTYADNAGRYSFSGLSAGVYYLRTTYNSEGLVNLYYGNSLVQSSATPVTVEADKETPDIDFALPYGSMITGTITQATDGQPIQGVYFTVYDNSGNYVPASYSSTDASGHYYVRGLAPGTYFLLANYSGSTGYGYLSNYYISARDRTAATPISLGTGAKLSDVDFSLAPAGAVSGRILSKSDNTPISGSYAYAVDSSGNYISGSSSSSDASGRFTLRNLPAGNVYVTAYASGYSSRYYRDATSLSAATPIQITAGSQTTGIDILLPKSSPSPLESAQDRGRAWSELSQAPGSGLFSGAYGPPEDNFFPPDMQITGSPDGFPPPDVTSTTPFIDPYRGVKIELVETTGSGADARAKLRITLSRLQFNPGRLIYFGQLPMQGVQTRELTVTNLDIAAVTVGTASIRGRNAGNFSISRDGCSGASLAPSAGCKIEVRFSPTNYSGNTAGEFAVLRIPSNDGLANEASVDLLGTVLAADPDIYQYLGSALTVGQNSTLYIQVVNRGTVRFNGAATITEKLPPGLRFVSVDSAGWSCSTAGQDVSCSRTLDLSPGYAVTLQMTVAVEAEAAPYCMIRGIFSSASDNNPANNSYTTSQMVNSVSAASYGPNLFKEQGTYTGIALYNGGTAAAALTLTALSPSGGVLGNPEDRVLKPGEQLVNLDSEFWGLPDDQRARMNWFSVRSSTQRVFGFSMAFDGALNVLDGATLARSAARVAVLPDIVTKDYTKVHVVNPNSSGIDLTIDLVSADGYIRATARRYLAPNGALLESVTVLFPGTSAAESDYVRISGSGSFMATEEMGIPGQWIKVLSAQDANAGSQILYASQYVTSADYWRSTISIVNLDATAAQVSARLLDDTGKQTGQTLLLPIRAKGKILMSAQDLFSQVGTSGYVEIRSDSTRLAGSVTFGDKDGKTCAELPLQTADFRELVFGQVASDSTWYTGLAVVNPNSTDVSATFQILDKLGNVVDSTTQLIQAGQRKIGLISEFFPKAAAEGVGSGYMRVLADQPLAGLALFGTANTLSAIPSYGIR